MALATPRQPRLLSMRQRLLCCASHASSELLHMARRTVDEKKLSRIRPSRCGQVWVRNNRPMTSEWYVSFHGGDEKETLNNIHVYSNDGRELRKALNTKSLAVGVTLRELRGFVFGPDQNLYVVNSHYEYSEVLKFKGALNNDGQHDFVGIFVKRDSVSNPGISHPFNAVFDSEGDLYV